MIVFNEVFKSYDGVVPALAGINLSIKKGELVTLLGPSGSGKSTLIKLINGMELPTSGDLILDELRLNDIPSHRRPVGTVFQDYGLFPHMSIYENLAFPLFNRKLKNHWN